VNVHFFRQRFEQLRRCKESAHFAVLQNGHRLVHHVIHILAGHVELLRRNHLFHEAGIEIDEVTRAAPHVRQMLDRQPQPPRSCRPHHQPRPAAREMLVTDFLGKLRVIHFVILPPNALLGHSGRASGFKNIVRAPLKRGRHPDFGLQITQPFVLEMREFQ
jgi:hypothetical protein